MLDIPDLEEEEDSMIDCQIGIHRAIAIAAVENSIVLVVSVVEGVVGRGQGSIDQEAVYCTDFLMDTRIVALRAGATGSMTGLTVVVQVAYMFVASEAQSPIVPDLVERVEAVVMRRY